MIQIRKITQSLCLLSICFFLNNVGYAQSSINQTIRGRVIDKHSQTSLPGVNVILESVDPIIGTSTDAEGYFEINNVSIGRHNIKFSYMGYEDVLISNVMLISSKQLVLDISMEEKYHQVEEVVVIGTGKTETINKMATVSARAFTVEETQRYAGSLNDVSRMAMNFAGVQSSGDAVNDIVIRGNSPIGLLWRLEGVDIPNPNHFGDGGATGGPVGMLNNNVLSKSDFFTGAFPSEYGNAVSGVFDLHLRKGNDQKHEFLGQVGFNGFELGAEGPLSKSKRASYLINYRYSTLDVMSKLGMDFGTGTAIPRYQDLSGKLHLPTSNIGTFDIFWLGGYSSIEFIDSKRDTTEERVQTYYQTSEMDIYQKTWMGVLGISHKKVYDNDWYSKITIATTYSNNGLEVDTVNPQRNPIPVYRSYRKRTNWTAHALLNKKINRNHNLRIGAIATYRLINMHDYSVEGLVSDDKINFDGNAIFFQPYLNWQYRILEDVTLNSGIHTQIMTLNNKYTIEPRVGLRWAVCSKANINLGYGLHSQMAMLDDILREIKQDDNTILKPNKNLDFMKSHHFVIGYDRMLSKSLHTKIELYYQQLFDVPVAKDSDTYSLLNRGSFSFYSADYLVNEGKGENFGIEFTLEKYMNKGFYALATASLFESKYMAYDKVWRNSAFNGNYVFNALGGKEFELTKKEDAKKNRNLSIDIKYTHAGGQYYSPINLEKSRIMKRNEYMFDKDNAYSKKFDDYIRFDIKIGFKVIEKKITQEYALDLQNLFNRKNAFQEVYNPSTDNIEMQYQTGFFPMMLYRITF